MSNALFDTTPGLTAQGSSISWRISRDGDPIALSLYLRHYSARQYADRRARSLFVGPGEKLVLVAHDDSAMFVWRRFFSMDDQTGICCAVFRNEGAALASDLIREADAIADVMWPDEPRHYTYVDEGKVASSNPGYCFLMAGWRRCGHTKGGHGRNQLLVLERIAS